MKLRKRAWQGREVPLEPEAWTLFSSAGLAARRWRPEQASCCATLQRAIADVLTPHQRRVLVALALNGVPIDVLAEPSRHQRAARSTRRCTTHVESSAATWTSAAYPFNRLRRRRDRAPRSRKRPRSERDTGPLLGPDELPKLGAMLCFDQLDRYVGLELAGADVDATLPGLRAHLQGCPACREEHESLRPRRRQPA